MAIAAEEVTFTPVDGGGDGLDTLARLYRQLTRSHGSAITLDAAREKLGLMLAAGAEARLMRHGDRLIGCVTWMDMGDHYFIRNFVIEEMVRGEGLGAAIVARLTGELLADKPVRLEASNLRSQAFWAAQGFQNWSVGYRFDGPKEAH
ncbi:MAG: GNAT family N-acetyltransferase [Pseudomonadota bacterium]